MYLIRKTENFDKWLRKLKDITVKGRILARLKQVELGNLGVCKAVGKGVSEMKIDYGPGYRIYFIKQGKITVILLAGGTKSRQEQDIARAQKLAAAIGGNDG